LCRVRQTKKAEEDAAFWFNKRRHILLPFLSNEPGTDSGAGFPKFVINSGSSIFRVQTLLEPLRLEILFFWGTLNWQTTGQTLKKPPSA
jgi:hypothetical protein